MRRDDWPQEIPKKPMLLATPIWQRQPLMPTWRQRRAGMSPVHLALVRQLPCSVCPDRRVIQAHHLKSLGAMPERGLSLKATDRWAVPLCWLHHHDIEGHGSRREVEWFAAFGLDAHALAQGLWNRTGDLGAMARVLETHQQQAILTLSAGWRTQR